MPHLTARMAVFTMRVATFISSKQKQEFEKGYMSLLDGRSRLFVSLEIYRNLLKINGLKTLQLDI
jgi:hypothetical protein